MCLIEGGAGRSDGVYIGPIGVQYTIACMVTSHVADAFKTPVVTEQRYGTRVFCCMYNVHVYIIYIVYACTGYIDWICSRVCCVLLCRLNNNWKEL